MKKILILLALFTPYVLSAEFPIISNGITEISYLDANNVEQHHITCHEKVELDFNFNYLQCLSHGHDLEKQIHFHDELHDLYSDQLRATYVHKDGAFSLDQLKIYGNVCLIQKEDPAQIIAFDELQYALADQLDYSFTSDQITLRAKEGSSVLYYDQLNNYRISAPEVLLRRSPETNQAMVDGKGKVRFVFEEDELEKFKTHFFGKGKDFEHDKL
ncbi:MAG: hypothetical protein S4CHLAM6_11010 [Chlamydiae bacterium]|nr:hypothetical protein [Chlamydiota bacterium]